MSYRSCFFVFFWACMPVVASADYFSTECSYCSDPGYKQAAVNAVPFPPGGKVLVIDYPQETLKNYQVHREEGPDGLYIFAYEIAVPADKQADFDAVINFVNWVASSDLELDLPPGLGIYSAYDVINNWGNIGTISDWINQQSPVASHFQGVAAAFRGFLGSHNPNIEMTVEVTMPDGSVVRVEAVSQIITTADGTKLVIEFEPLFGTDTDGNRIYPEAQAWVGQSGVASGSNVAGLSSHLSLLGFAVNTQGDSGGDMVCDWACSGDTCTLTCAPATE